jgi:methionyl-tRNA formyltransferase
MHTLEPGKIVSDNKTYLRIACNYGYLNILSLQIEGKKRMPVTEFLKGFRVSDYHLVTNSQV